jgi:fused signal recognition particle receptor
MFSLWKKKKPEPVPQAPEPAAPPALDVPGDAEVRQQAEAFDAPTQAPASWGERLRGIGFAKSFGTLFAGRRDIDDDLIDEIETSLLTSDAGVAATETVMAELRRRHAKGEFADSRDLLATLRGLLVGMLRPIAQPLLIDRQRRPFVILTVGVNGVGKTTTIGKLARRYADERHAVMLAAGDTFRAAAVEQLTAWGERNKVPVIAQGEGADSASVIYDALQSAKSRGIDLLIADTAGRLHTQAGLMDELSKVKRVLGKLDPSAPHEVLLVIDGNTGQNAVNQVRQFHKAVAVTGLVVTKLDGTAKGGVIFALAREFGLPIRFVGLGEKVHDLRAFDPDAFVDALLPASLAG